MTDHQKVLGIISDERAYHSLSPAMHKIVMDRVGYNGLYVPLPVPSDRVGEAVRGIRALGLVGVNVTVPYKEAVIPFVDELGPEAEAMGAVNTIINQDGKLIGRNTDSPGLADCLDRAGTAPQNQRVVVFGLGGAAKATLYTVNQYGPAEVILVGRKMDRATALAWQFQARPVALDELTNQVTAADLAVNATSVSSPEEAPELADLLAAWNPNGLKAVIDLNYGRQVNIWRTLAQRKKAVFEDGLALLAAQAIHSFRFWTGLEVPWEYYKEAVERIK